MHRHTSCSIHWCGSTRHQGTYVPRSPGSRPRSCPVVVNLFHLQGMLLDELAARFDLFSHEDAEHFIRLESVVELHSHERSLFGVERRLPQLLTVHFTEALEARDRQAAFALATDLAHEVAEMKKFVALLAVFQVEARRGIAAGDPRRRHQVGSAEAEFA